MKKELFRYLAGVIIGVVLTLTVGVVILSKSDKVTTLASIQAFSPITILVSALIALFLYFENIKKNQDDRLRQKSNGYLCEAKQLLERAYQIFIKEGKPPSNKNVDWRTTALLILKSKELEKNITEQDHKVAFDGHKQYFAVLFHRALWNNIGHMDLQYFMPTGNPLDTQTISRKAIAVIFQFAHSVSNDYERLDNMDSALIFASNSVPPEFLGVENLLGQYQELWARVQKLKKVVMKISNRVRAGV